MAYTTQSNIIKAISREVLIQLTDDDDTGVVVAEIVDYNIDLAQKEIDGFIRGRYPADMEDADVPAEIINMCTNIAVYYLYRRRLQLTLPDTIRDGYKMTMKRLQRIQEGKESPFESNDEPETIKTNKTVYSRTFNSSVWGQY